MIKSKDLDNRDQEFLRAEADAVLVKHEAQRTAAAELAALKARLAAARHLPPPKDVDGRAWALGRNAAIEAIVGS